MKKMLFSMMLTTSISMPVMAEEVSLARFFGDCENAGVDTSKSVGEACIIQSIINAASKEIKGVTVNTLPTDWGSYYDQIKASYASGNAPDIHTLHRSRISEFASLGALADLTDDLAEAGVDTSDWEPTALDAVIYKNKIYAVPMDFHANLFHVNMDLMEAAGLVKDGKPILPTSTTEMLEQARQVKKTTGADYLAAEFGSGVLGARIVLAWIWQQGGNVYENGKATINTPEAHKALEAILPLFKEGLARRDINYGDAQQSFLNGKSAILVNGTWVVDFYTEEAKKSEVALNHYYVADFPRLFTEEATWADSHMWAIPASLKAKNPAKYKNALKVLAFINDHNLDWARTGHMSVRTSVLGSDAYSKLPHRNEYIHTAQSARDVPPAVKYGAIQDVLAREIRSTWLIGKSIDQALSDAESDVQDLLN